MKSPYSQFVMALALSATCLAQTEAPSALKVEDVSAPQAAKMLTARKDVMVLDLRTPEEFKTGHLAGARNVDFLGKDFEQQLGALDKTKTYLIHCASGGRSTRALKIFERQKFQSLLHLKEGFKGWEAAGQPVEK